MCCFPSWGLVSELGIGKQDRWFVAVVGVKTGGSRVGGPELCV